MALVQSFAPDPRVDPQWKTTTECGYRVADINGEPILSLVTYGSAGRQVPGKGSQYVHLNEESAADLMRIIREAFPHL